MSKGWSAEACYPSSMLQIPAPRWQKPPGIVHSNAVEAHVEHPSSHEFQDDSSGLAVDFQRALCANDLRGGLYGTASIDPGLGDGPKGWDLVLSDWSVAVEATETGDDLWKCDSTSLIATESPLIPPATCCAVLVSRSLLSVKAPPGFLSMLNPSLLAWMAAETHCHRWTGIAEPLYSTAIR